ncbi:MAG: hypothetical protein R6W82_00455 [bacterium]
MEQTINHVARERGEFRPEAYFFTLDALQETVEGLNIRRHVSGPEVLRGVVRLAHERFGETAHRVLDGWGIQQTRDFGVIVYDLIEAGILSHTEQDSLEDFEDVFDLEEALSEEAWRQRWRISEEGSRPLTGGGLTD